MTSHTPPETSFSCTTCGLIVLVAALSSLVALYFFLIALEHSHTTIFTYENRSEAKYLVGGKNESYAGLYESFRFIEVDMDVDSFDSFAKLENMQFLPIGEEGVYVTCFKFNSIHPSQKNSFDSYIGDDEWHTKRLPASPSSDKPLSDIWYQHHVIFGFYFIEDASEITYHGDKTLLVYDTDNCRMFWFSGPPQWFSVPSAINDPVSKE